MMFVVCHVISAWFAFFLPCYSTFKALAHRPLSEPDLERWAMYWSVIGAFTTVEYAAEWLVSWFPFYWEIKMLFLLFLSLPQTQGSTYVYKTYVEPLFTAKETDIDAGIEAAKTNTLAFLKKRFSALWELLWSILSKTPAVDQKPAGEQNGVAPPANPLASVGALWNTFGPTIMGALQRSAGQAPGASQANGRSAEPAAAAAMPGTPPRAPATPEVKVDAPLETRPART